MIQGPSRATGTLPRGAALRLCGALACALALVACGGSRPGAQDEESGGFSLPSLPRPGIPTVFKVRIQQGNVVTQEMVDRLAPGMTRAQVEYVLGEPVLRNTFREERWDYLFTLTLGDRLMSKQVVSVYFEDGRLAAIEGDLKPSEAEGEDDAEPGDTLAGTGEAAPDEGEPSPADEGPAPPGTGV